MATLKIDHVRKAYEQLVISGITTEVSPEEAVIGLERLEDMMAEFHARNICSNWLYEDTPNPNTDPELEREYNTAVETNLAVRLCAIYGKNPMQTLVMMARQSLSNWSALSSKTNEILPPRRQPRGSGNTFRYENWIRFFRFENNAPISCDTFEIKENQEDFFLVDFDNFLIGSNTITEFTIDSTPGIDVLESTQVGNTINLKCRGVVAGYNTVTITVTTSSGRINPQLVNFSVIRQA